MKPHLALLVFAALLCGQALASPAPAPSSAAPSATGDAARGATLFKQRCATCHAVAAGVKSPMGPNLVGVANRKAAAGAFAYSPALQKSGLVWDAATLDAYLTLPPKKVPGTSMYFAVGDAKDRADLIAYLATVK